MWISSFRAGWNVIGGYLESYESVIGWVFHSFFHRFVDKSYILCSPVLNT